MLLCMLAGVAEEVLQLTSCDHATAAIRSLCRSELIALSRSGVFDRKRESGGSLLWAILTMIARHFYVETQSVEGLNSIVKLIGRRCPNISLELLSSRLTIKHSIGQADGATGCGKKWSKVKAVAERKVLQLTDQATTSLQVLCDEKRWPRLCQWSSLGGGSHQLLQMCPAQMRQRSPTSTHSFSP